MEKIYQKKYYVANIYLLNFITKILSLHFLNVKFLHLSILNQNFRPLICDWFKNYRVATLFPNNLLECSCLTLFYDICHLLFYNYLEYFIKHSLNHYYFWQPADLDFFPLKHLQWPWPLIFTHKCICTQAQPQHISEEKRVAPQSFTLE